ncbi:restriction endonuclease subunit S [Streptomyces olivaceus]|uniref:restriction endonuclease subunit S n=1 Tax=Streptomyces olivaceus TaxID=47716 RepID=UPI00364166B9
MGVELRSGGDGWALLGSVLDGIESGWSPACDAEQPDVDEWGVVKVSAVTSGRFIDGEAKRLPMGQVQRPELEIKRGDVLLARANGARSLVGVSCYVTATRPRLMLSDKVLRLIPNRTAVDPVYLAILLGTLRVRSQIGNLLNGGTGQNNITQADVRALEIPQLPLPEQRDIVAAHEAFERRIGDLERVAQKRSTLLSAAVSALLQSQDSSGSTLETMMVSCDPGITLGAHRAPQKRATGYLRVANVRMGWIDTSDVASLESTSSDRPRYELEAGDVLVVEGHANPEQIGRAALVGPVEEGLLYQNHLFRLRFDRDEVVPEFAMLWLNSEAVRSYWISRCATSSGLYTINSKLLADAPFPAVPIKEQRKIVETWRTGLRAVDSLHGQIAKLRTIQQGVVEDLLSGRSRVNRT